MRILLIATAYNALTQRAHLELTLLGHNVSIELSLNDEIMREGIALFKPDLIICPFLKDRIPDDLWQNHTCIIIHPGIKGDRGASSMDWAMMDGVAEWGNRITSSSYNGCWRYLGIKHFQAATRQ